MTDHWCTYCNGMNTHNCQFNPNLPRMTTHAAVCWSWGPKHYECVVREIERLRAEVERWAQSAHEGWRYAKECDDGRVKEKRRTVTYVCPVCAASLERQE